MEIDPSLLESLRVHTFGSATNICHGRIVGTSPLRVETDEPQAPGDSGSLWVLDDSIPSFGGFFIGMTSRYERPFAYLVSFNDMKDFYEREYGELEEFDDWEERIQS